MASIIHSLGNVDFTTYQYHQVYVSTTGTVLGESIVGPIVLDIGISSTGNTSGAGVFLIGKKIPEQLLGTNSDGSYSIKG
jgi:hypothetical protein